MKLFIMQCSPASRHLFPLRSKFSPRHPVLIHSQSMWIASFHTLKTFMLVAVASLLLFPTSLLSSVT
jgi:hypothetical protein